MLLISFQLLQLLPGLCIPGKPWASCFITFQLIPMLTLLKYVEGRSWKPWTWHIIRSRVEPNFQRVPCLKSLSLSYISISALDLSILLSTCPKIEKLELVNLDIAMSDAQVTVELSSPTLKSIYVEAINLDKFILEADTIECLHSKDFTLELFELIGKGTLKHFKMDAVSVIHLDIGDTVENLEIVDISNYTIIWPKFYQIISRSSKLRRLRLWDVVFDAEDEMADIETIAVCFPQLSNLALSYDWRDGVFGLQGSSHLENVIVLELGWTVINDLFSHWGEGLLKRCPSVRKLVIHGIVSETNTDEECQMLANFTSAMIELMRR